MLDAVGPRRCSCGTDIGAGRLACPGCGALVHAAKLKELQAEAENATARVDALVAWRSALALLPPDSRQYEVVLRKVNVLVEEIDRLGGGTPKRAVKDSSGKKGATAGVIGVLVLLLSKFKFVLTFLFTKGHLLISGLLKGSTLFSMFAAFGAYWTIWGWKFAAGFVGAIYVHEMGHVYALKKFGIRATAPMFIPGIGAIVRLQERLHSPIENARVGLAGPWWGLGATVAIALSAWGTGSRLAFALAHTSAWLNLFNLTPIWQLDGSRGFAALSKKQRGIAAATLVAIFFATGDLLSGIAAGIGVFRVFGKDAYEPGNARTLADFCFLALALVALMRICAG